MDYDARAKKREKDAPPTGGAGKRDSDRHDQKYVLPLQ
jgi:hypothetical protein